MPSSLSDRFWSKVDKSGECWIWKATTVGQGHGVFCQGRGPGRPQRTTAHRWAWEQEYGPVPTGLYVCHHCDNPRCVRPSHLFTGDHAANMRDMANKGRAMKGATHIRAKLSEDQVDSIRRQYAAGMTLTAIAATLPVCRQQVSKIVHGENWRHSLARHQEGV